MKPSGPFEIAIKSALLDIVESHASPSKFGYHLSKSNMEEMVESLYQLFLQSRSLKEAGDRFLAKSFGASDPRKSPTRF
jgi:hypothetical protein